MVFKRRNRRSFGQTLTQSVWPRGGWGRAAHYMKHRLRRLPDAPHRIARGIWAGVFISFTPLFGLHFGVAALLSWILRGNMIAALMATFVGNPVTFPFIATLCVEFGNWLLGHPGVISPIAIFADFGYASAELWTNIAATFRGEPAHWDQVRRFFFRIYLPYLVGGLLPGIIGGTIGYYVSLPVILAYQNRRKKKLRDKLERRIAEREGLADKGPAPAPEPERKAP